MGVIKDGTISGNLPSTKLFAVHYPAYPSSVQRAVETLGGLQGIRKARSSETNKLELHFRPEDPYSHPAFGELFPSKSFLLKISRKEEGKCESANDTSEKYQCSSSYQESSCPESIENLRPSQHVNELNADSANIEVHIPNKIQENLFADIIAEVSEAYEFNGMADYQHVLAVHADVARRKKRNWADVEPKFDKQGLMDVDQEDLMILVPPLFSPKDIPERVALKPLVDVSLKKKREGLVQNHWEMDIEPCLAIDFNIKEVPKKVSWENHIPKGSVQWGLQVAICNLFDERPIWKKDSFVEQLVDKGLIIGDYMLRRLLFRAAYYFSNGPFLKFWIRKGYDPRKDPESRIYQRTDFRVPPSLRSYCDANVGLKQRWKDICSFRVFPYKCQTSFQLVELVDDYIQEEIRKASNQPICSLVTGWFSSHMLHMLRLRVHVRFLEICPIDGGKPFLKSASDRFEKAKKMHFLVKDQKLDNAQEEIVKDLVDNEEKELNDDDEDDEDDEDEIEDDNAEEEFDAYDGLDLAGEEGNVSVQTGLLQENISKNYLQELFGSFPFSEAGGGFQLPDAANSDEEYQIYEQDSDGNYSGDDY